MKISIKCPEGRVTRKIIQPEQSALDAAAADIAAAGDALGKIFCRQTDSGPYAVFYGLFSMAEKTLLQIQADEPALQMLAVLGGNSHFTIDGIGGIYLAEGQFNILYAPDAELTLPFNEPNELLIVNVYFPLELLLYYQQLFPLQAFVNEIKCNRAALLQQQPGWMTNLILNVMTFLSKFRHRDKAHDAHMWELKMKELLLLALHQSLYPDNKEIPEKDLEAVKKARHIMEARVSEKLSLEQVAALSGISPDDLKKYFKLVAGITLFEFNRQVRINHAKMLLVETTLSIPEIATMAGYNHPMDFIQKFKEYTGFTPVSFRKSQR